MTRLGGLLIGLFTTLLFLGMGGMMLASGRPWWGGGLLVLGVFRGAVLYRQYKLSAPPVEPPGP